MRAVGGNQFNVARWPSARTLTSEIFPRTLRASVSTLFEQLRQRVNAWKQQGFTHEEFPIVGEILLWATDPDGSGFRLRPPQIRALETYWYLRLVENTPKIFDLYQK